MGSCRSLVNVLRSEGGYGVAHELLQEQAEQPYLHRVQRHVHVDEHGVVVGKVASPWDEDSMLGCKFN